ncbi:MULTISPECIES: beta-N-acetylhexosaminidase [Cycloclasticus]|jgi:beta-N-acetylhexosaminidase|uniref:Beta-hexosaminidase n=1 Tax=Cycloclasticus pugetii TaxID=34068 RepID=A0AB33Z499_9GAMM|nr:MULTISPECIES: beta-N-acetylhexosaminidase [Cycloclasticus]ATI03494.1 beta-N-acetylhexosaminidase [Cycloclasticus sp. PY97N]EPD13977.1 beta-hexosaminidase [Cycloclasticus pugetii]
MKSPMPLGPLMIDIDSVELSAVDREVLKHPLVGGVILFSRNYDSIEQVSVLCDEIHRLRAEPLLLAVDHEGGRVQRFKEGFTPIPCMQMLGECYQEDKENALNYARQVAWLMAMELRQVGVDFSFAPVLDIDYACSDVIGDRAFSSDKKIVAELAEAFQQGLAEAGMASIGKHFPGHGAVAPDSHVAIPIDERSLEDILQDDVYPFRQLIQAGMKGIMPAHVIYQQVDEMPAGFSEFWLQTILRQQLGFQGAIFSDDLTMQGASVVGDIGQRAQQALKAGGDMALICNDRTAAEQVIDHLNGVEINTNSIERLKKMRPTTRLPEGHLQGSLKWQQCRKIIDGFN